MTDHPRSLSDLRSFLYGYRIGNSGPTRWYLRERASIIIAAIDGQRPFSQAVRWTARELAELDPSLSWLPGWKPRVAVAAKGDVQ